MQERMDAETLMNLLRPMPVHQRVATLRKLYNISQGELAEKVGVERGSVSSWEAEPGQDRAHAPAEDSRAKMAEVFGIPAYVLTPDFGMQNYEQIGYDINRELRGRKPVGPKMEQVAATAAELQAEYDRQIAQLNAESQAQMEVAQAAVDDYVAKQMSNLEPQYPRQPVQDPSTPEESRLTQIRPEAPVKQEQESPDGVKPPPPGVRRIG